MLRPWQIDLVASAWDADPAPRLTAWCLPRGQGKSSLVAAMGIYALLTAGEDVSVDVVAVDERQAGIVFGMAAKYVARHPDLESRVKASKDRLVIPSRSA